MLRSNGLRLNRINQMFCCSSTPPRSFEAYHVPNIISATLPITKKGADQGSDDGGKFGGNTKYAQS
jgi:hypothetical protein